MITYGCWAFSIDDLPISCNTLQSVNTATFYLCTSSHSVYVFIVFSTLRYTYRSRLMCYINGHYVLICLLSLVWKLPATILDRATG